jgi:hypothetical protein
MILLLRVQEMLMVLEGRFAMQRGAKDKQVVEDQMPQNRLEVLMLRKGVPRLVEQVRKGMLQLQEWGELQKSMGQLDLQLLEREMRVINFLVQHGQKTYKEMWHVIKMPTWRGKKGMRLAIGKK